MQRILIAVTALAVMLAACSGQDASGVATLEDPSDGAVVEELSEQTSSDDEHSDEEAVLGFAKCMRYNGIEGFEDPDVTADGSLDFRRGQGQLGDVDRQTLRDAFRACQEHLEGLAFGPGRGDFDRSEIEDRLVEFSACMRDPDRGNLPDFPDPDFSNFGPGNGGPGGGGPFGEGFDFQDPAVQGALEACQDVFGGFRFGGPGSGGRGRGDIDGTSA